MNKLIFVFALCACAISAQTVVSSVPNVPEDFLKDFASKSLNIPDWSKNLQDLVSAQLAQLNAMSTTDLTKLGSSVQGTLLEAEADLKTLTTSADQSIKDFLVKHFGFTGKIQAMSSLVQELVDARSAIGLECEGFLVQVAKALVAERANALANAKALLDFQNLAKQLSDPSFLFTLATNPAAKTDALKTAADIKARTALCTSLKDKIDLYNKTMYRNATKCALAAQKQAGILAMDLKANWEEIQATITNAGSDIPNRFKTIIQTALGDKLASFSSSAPVLDEASKTVSVAFSDLTVNLGPNEIPEDLLMRLSNLLKSIASGILTNGADVSVTLVKKGTKRQTGTSSFSGSITSSSFPSNLFNIPNMPNPSSFPSIPIPFIPTGDAALKTYEQAIVKQLTAAGTNVDQLKTQLSVPLAQLDALKTQYQTQLKSVQTTATQLQTTLSSAQTSFKSAQDALISEVTSAKASFDSTAVKDTLTDVQALLKVRSTQITQQLQELETKLAAKKAYLASLEVKRDQLKALLVSTVQELQSTTDANVKQAVQAKLDSLYKDMQTSLADTAFAQQQVEDIQGLLTSTGLKLKAEAEDISKKISSIAQSKLGATATNIQTRAIAAQADMADRFKGLLATVNTNIKGVTIPEFVKTPTGVKSDVQVVYDSTLAKVDEVKAYLTALIKGEFSTDKVTVTAKANAKRADELTSFEVIVASSDNSVAQPDSSASNGSALSVGAIVGIVIACVVVVVVVIVIALLARNRGDDDKYSSML